MAAKAQHVTFKRFDGKLDAVLRKTLPMELYERLSVTESCVVVTHGGKKAQRHVILGHTALYFAEVPPKTVKRAIELVDVVSAKTVCDVPNFLPESERNDAIHIQIIYNVLSKTTPDHTDDNNERSRSASPKMLFPSFTTGAVPTRSVTPTAKAEDKRLTLLRGHELASSQDSLWSSTLSLTPVSANDEQLTSYNVCNNSSSSDNRKRATLDIYVLGNKGSSQLGQYLNVYLEDTLMRILGGLPSNTSLPSYEVQQDSLVSTFLSMKSELLHCTHYEEVASLMTELKQGADKYFVLKRMFWQDLQLLEYCIEQLSLAKTSVIKDCCEKIEYNLIVSDLLLTVFSETHIIQNRTVLITTNRGTVITRLVNGLMELFNADESNTEINQSLNELTGIVAGVLYELMRMTVLVEQSRAIPDMDNTVSPSWLCEIACSHEAAVRFLTRLVWLICDRKDTDTRQLTCYRLVSFIHQLIHHSDSALKLCRTNFTEEFRYIIPISNSQSVIEDKINLVRSKVLTK